MERQMISALDLFRRYHARYPRIEMGKLGFSGDLTDAGRFYLTPQRSGKPLGHKTRQLGFPYVDVLEAGMELEAKLKGVSGVAPHLQMQDAYWQKIQEDFLRGRRFTVHIYEPYFPRWYSVSLTDRDSFPARFKTWPAIKRGLVINRKGEAPVTYLHWSAFVPEGTPEHAAIQASLDVAIRLKEPKMPVPKDEIARMQDDFFAKLALVAA